MKARKFVASLSILVMLLVISVVTAQATFACTSVLVGKDASIDGSVLTSHTCDGQYDSRVTVVKGATFKPGDMRPVYKGGGDTPANAAPLTKVGEIPQVAQTFTYFNAAYPFMNEHQVAMGETTVGGRRELYNAEGWFQIWELQRVALERARTAREAVQIMGSMAEKYGYGDYGECLTVIDSKEAWVFEVFGAGPLQRGSVWAARRVPDGEVFVSANRSRIGELHLEDKNNYMASKNVIEFATQMGWYTPGKPFIFNQVYGPKNDVYNSRREWRALSLLAPSLKLDPWASEYPFSVKPDKKVSPKDIMAINRDHYEGTEFDLTKGLAAGPFGNPNRYPTSTKTGTWERAISIFRCSYSTVIQSRSWLPDALGGLVWFGEDAGHSTCYVPLYAGMLDVPESFKVGQRDIFSRDSAWWAFNLVSNIADLKYSYMIKDIQAVYTAYETEAFAMQPAVEKAALELYKNDPAMAQRFITDYSINFANRVVSAYWTLFEDLMGKYNDGYVDGKTVGYPDEWLKAVNYGPIVKPSK